MKYYIFILKYLKKIKNIKKKYTIIIFLLVLKNHTKKLAHKFLINKIILKEIKYKK